MDIKQLVTKPKVIELEINTPEIIEKVGDSIVFYMKDHLDLATYFDFYKLQQNNDMNELMNLLRRVVLDSEGNPAIGPDEILPVDITLAILFKINDHVGKSNAKASMSEPGTVQS